MKSRALTGTVSSRGCGEGSWTSHRYGAAFSCLLIAALQNTALVTPVSFYALSVQFSVLVSRHVIGKPGNRIHKGLEIWYREWLALYRNPAGILYACNHYYTVNAASSSRVMVTLERNVLLRLRSNCN